MTLGIMAGQCLPDYQQCVSLIHVASLKEMVLPGLVAVFAPVVVGLSYKGIGVLTNDEMLAPTCLAAFLMIATIVGICFSLFLNNAGGAWDNV